MENINNAIIREAFTRHEQVWKETLERILPQIIAGAELLKKTFTEKKKLLVCGNGGSAADSQHFAAEWLVRYKKERGPLPAIALSTDTSTLTAIGNDYSFEEIFKRQVQALGSEGDTLVAFTTSGSSKNIVQAIKEAKQKKMNVIVLTGEKGSHLTGTVDLVIAVPSVEPARIQEMHELIYHSWCEHLDFFLSE